MTKMKTIDQTEMEDHVTKFNHNMNQIFFLLLLLQFWSRLLFPAMHRSIFSLLYDSQAVIRHPYCNLFIFLINACHLDQFSITVNVLEEE